MKKIDSLHTYKGNRIFAASSFRLKNHNFGIHNIDNFQDKLALSIHTKALKSINRTAFIPINKAY